MWHIELLGVARVLDNEKKVTELPRSTALLLLGFLATQTKPLKRDEISAHLFPNASNRNRASSTLRGSLHALKKSLADDEQPLFLKNGNTIALNRGVFRCDLWSFQEDIIASRHASNTENCLSLLKNAVELYGEFFPIDEELDWLSDLRTQLEAEFLNALSRLISLLGSLERWEETLRYLELYLVYSPYHPQLLLQKEQVRHHLLGGESFETRNPLVWTNAGLSQRERRKQFQILMISLEKRANKMELFSFEKRALEAAVSWCLETLSSKTFQFAAWIAILPSPLLREDAATLFDLSEKAFGECLAVLYDLRLIALKPDGLHMIVSLKERLLKATSHEEVTRIKARHAGHFTALATDWLERSPLPSPERNLWSENSFCQLCQALDWTIDHLPQEIERLYPLLSFIEDFLATHPATPPELYHFTDRILPRLKKMPIAHQFRLSVYVAHQMCRFQHRDRIEAPIEIALELLFKMDGTEADPNWVGSLIALGNALHHSGGRSRAAERVLRASLTLCERSERWEDLSRTYFELSECLWAKGRLQEARVCLQQSIFFLRRANTPNRATGIPLMNIGALELTLGNTEQAEEYLNEALTYLGEDTSLVAIADTLAYLGVVATRRGHFGLAQVLLTESRQRCDTLKQSANGMRATLLLGDNARAQRQYEKAEAYYYEALCFWRVHTSVGWIVISLSKLAEICLETEREEQAEAYAEEILALCQGTTGLASRACAFYVKGVLLSRRGEKGKAELFLKKAEALRSFLGIPMDFLRHQVPFSLSVNRRGKLTHQQA